MMRFVQISITILTAAAVVSCDISEPLPSDFSGMEPVDVYDLQVPEPSGLTLNTAATELYTVSDPGDNRVYKLALDGSLLATLSYQGDDLEGITYDDRDQTLWIVEEELREIVHIDTLGNELSRHAVNYPGLENNGFEGICLLPSGRFYVLNEMNPGALLELDENLDLVNVTELDFALDYSGICYVETSGELLILSDESRQVFAVNENLEVTWTGDLEFHKSEGIDFDPATNRLYLVNDSSADLSVYNLP